MMYLFPWQELAKLYDVQSACKLFLTKAAAHIGLLCFVALIPPCSALAQYNAMLYLVSTFAASSGVTGVH